MKQFYKKSPFRKTTLALIEKINAIIEEYFAQGYVLTVRQLYYQLVARGIIPNNLASYKKTARDINDARLAGLVDWDTIEDRTRQFIRRGRWDSPKHIVQVAHDSFHMDMWTTQDHRVFVIVEKEALVGVLERTCNEYDIPLLAARGYPSSSVLRDFARSDLMDTIRTERKHALVLHMGDHDPSGVDMTRDMEERLKLFAETPRIELRRVALNMDQIEDQKPPANPAKQTDSRFAEYADQFGDESWELDALQPSYLNQLVTDNVADVIDPDKWKRRRRVIEAGRKRIGAALTYMDKKKK